MGDSTIHDLPAASSVAATDVVPIDQGLVTRKATMQQVSAAVGPINVGVAIHAANQKTTPIDPDELGLVDTADGNTLKKLTWANVKATLLTYFSALTGTWNISTTGNAGSATKLQTARNLDVTSFDGTADVKVVAPAIHAATNKTTPVDADETGIWDSVSGLLNKVTWANIKTTLAGTFTTIASLAASGGTALVGFLQAGTGAVARTAQSKMRDVVSVFDFMTTAEIADVQARTALVDVTAAIQAAITAGYNSGNGVNLYFPPGVYLMSSTITMGDSPSTCSVPVSFMGEKGNSEIKVTAANVNPFLWQGPNPDVDGSGNRIDGRILIENMKFLGPSSFGTNTNSLGIKFYGVQGITLRNLTLTGWYAGEYYQNCDIVDRFNVYSQSNLNAVLSEATGYALNSSLNSFNSFGGLVANNTNYGIMYLGGISPSFFGVNFVLNGTSLVFSPNHTTGGMVTQTPLLSGCYFEGDTATSIIFGGGNGIVRGGIIDGGNMIAGAAVPLITIANYSNANGRGRINIPMDIGFPGSSKIDQSSSTEKIDFFSLNDTPIGDVTPNSGTFTTVRSALIIKTGILAGASVDILSVGSFSVSASLSLTVDSASSGIKTSKRYAVIVMGAGNAGAGTINALVTEDYSGGASPFTLSVVANSPVAGTNKLVLTNNSAVTCTFTIYYTTEKVDGTLTVL